LVVFILLLLLLGGLLFIVGNRGQEVLEPSLEQNVDRSLVLNNKVLLHEPILRVLDQLPEAYHEAPRVWPVNLKSFK
jgi:hypothetical protein